MVIGVLALALAAADPVVAAHALADKCFFAKALEYLDAAPAADQTDRANIIFRAQLLVRTGKAHESVATLKTLPPASDRERDTQRLVALLAAQAVAKHLPQAIETARIARRSGADVDIVDGLLATAYLAAGNTRSAEQILQRVLRRDPRLTGALYNLACIRAMQGDVAESAALIRMSWMLGYRDPDKLRADPWLAPVRAVKGLIDDLVDSPLRDCRIF